MNPWLLGYVCWFAFTRGAMYLFQDAPPDPDATALLSVLYWPFLPEVIILARGLVFLLANGWDILLDVFVDTLSGDDE